MKRRSRSNKLALALTLAVPLAGGSKGTARAQTPAARSTTKQTGIEKVQTVEGITEYRLANGLRVLLYPDASKPTVTVNATYFVGSRHEGYGETGMAHLLEHMLFKGTPTHPDIWKLLQDRGAKFNGTTWYDRTNYYEELPASPDNLTFAIALEADRMVNSKIAAEDLAKEFSVVRNEFEMGENDPARVLEEKMLATAYQWHNYGKSTIGSRADIERVPVDNLRAFYRRFYQPDNTLVIVAGKFDEKQALALVQQHFGKIPRPQRDLGKTWTVEPVQDGERQVTLRRNGEVAVVGLAYHGVAGSDPRWLAEDALVEILTAKPAGRLYKALVEKGLASDAYGYVFPTTEPGYVFLGAKVPAQGSPDKVRKIMTDVVEGLVKKPPTKEELDRWRTKSLKEFELALNETAVVGVVLSDWAALGDWRLLFHTRDRIKALTVDDVVAVAKDFLKESNRTVGLFLPTKAPDRAPFVEAPDVNKVLADYKPSEKASEGEAFAATIENVEARTTRGELPSGMKLALLPKKTKGGTVRVVLTVRYGNEATLKGHVVTAGIIPPMMLRGTKKHSFQELKDELDRLKAEVNFGGGRFAMGTPGVAQVRIKTVRDNLPAVLELVTEALREPAFAPKEVENLRKEMLAQLEEQLQDPMANGFLTLARQIFPWAKEDVRYIPTVKESIDRIKAASPAELGKLHKSLWGGSASQLAIVGDFDAEATRGLLAKGLGAWKSPKAYERVTRPYRDGRTGDERVDTPDKQMAFVGVGHPIEVRDDDPDYPALLMMNHILGGSASSRLLNRLRQKEGLSYGAFSSVDAHAQDRSGYVFAGAICAPQNADKAMNALLEELASLRDKGVSAQELADAKKSYAATFESKLAEDDFVAGELAKGLYLGRTFAYWRDVNAKVAKLTAEDVQAAAKKFLQPDKLARVKAGDLPKRS